MMSSPADLSGGVHTLVRDPLRAKTNWAAALRAATHLPGTPLASRFPAPVGFIPKLSLFLLEHLEGLGDPEELPWAVGEEVLMLVAEVWRFMRPDTMTEANIEQALKSVDRVLQAMSGRHQLMLASPQSQEMYQRMLTGMRMVISRLLDMAPALLGDELYAAVRSRLLRQHESFEVTTGHFARLNTSRTWSLPPPSASLQATSQRIFMHLSSRHCLYPLQTALAKLPQDVPVVPFPKYEPVYAPHSSAGGGLGGPGPAGGGPGGGLGGGGGGGDGAAAAHGHRPHTSAARLRLHSALEQGQQQQQQQQQRRPSTSSGGRDAASADGGEAGTSGRPPVGGGGGGGGLEEDARAAAEGLTWDGRGEGRVVALRFMAESPPDKCGGLYLTFSSSARALI